MVDFLWAEEANGGWQLLIFFTQELSVNLLWSFSRDREREINFE